MSMGYGGSAHLMASDDSLVIYSYCCYNIDLPDYKQFINNEDGVLYIDRDAFAEPEIHEKIVRTPSGRKKTVIKRIKQDVPFEKLLDTGKIKIKNAGGTWQTAPSGEDIMALRMLFKIFGEYQETGELPESLSWHS